MVPKNKIQMFVLANYLIMSFIVFASCNTAEPPVPPVNANLTLVKDVISCTEAWLKLTSQNLHLPSIISLLQDDNIKKTITLSSQDTVLYIDSLLPNKSYQFQLATNNNDTKSNIVSVTTLDTTDHNYNWQTFTFGQHSSSTLYDVAIIDENNIWAVGEIYMNDSLGNPEPSCYNAVHWNSTGWELKRIRYYGACSAVEYPPLRSIYAFLENNIVITNGGSIGWFDGDTVRLDCGVNLLLTGAINKIWGSNSNDLYVVGNEGNIVSYNGTSWQKIESGTDIDIQDIFGSVNKESDELEIIALASNILANPRKRLLRIKNQNVETLPDSGLSNYLSTVWFISGRKYCIGGQGYYESRTFGPVWERNNTIPQFHITTIRGAGLNDIVLGGTFGLLMHFNGVSWMNYSNITASYFDVISSVAMKGNTIVAAGFKGSKSVVLVGKR